MQIYMHCEGSEGQGSSMVRSKVHRVAFFFPGGIISRLTYFYESWKTSIRGS